jgi:hypothetical protein
MLDRLEGSELESFSLFGDLPTERNSFDFGDLFFSAF